MKLDFRIEWGYQILYSRRHYHPVYCWDGSLVCENGSLEKLSQYHYPRCISGPVYSAVETPLEGNSWHETTRRALSGLHVIADGDENTVFHLRTASGNFDFSAGQLLNDGRIVFNVGPKYGNCHVSVIRTGFIWFRPPAKESEYVIDAGDLPLDNHHWSRMQSAWLAPGESVKFSAVIHKSGEQIFHLIAMAARYFDPAKENQAWDHFPMTLKCDGRRVAGFKHYFRRHSAVQMLEDVWARFEADAGTHEFELVNENKNFYLLINRMSFMPSKRPDEELVIPAWAVVGEKLYGRIYSQQNQPCRVDFAGRSIELQLNKGWNEFPFVLDEPGFRVRFTTSTGLSAEIEQVYLLPAEPHPLMVGADLTSVPHDDSGEMEWLLDYMNRTRLGNLIVIRSFIYRNPDSREKSVVCDELLEKWGNYCREHHIHVEAATDFLSGMLQKAAGEMMHSGGTHELTGKVYAFDPDHEVRPETMKEACENYLAYLKEYAALFHTGVKSASTGDASGGQRYCYMAGFDFVRAETMVPNTMPICSLARTASEALANGEWGVHIATQHAMQPYFMNQLGLFFLSLYQPWLMGANMFYEEDSLFLMWKEERQSWDDALTKGKRDMLRNFFKFAKTHPRQGKICRPIAFLEGRYAAPFNGFICGNDQDPSYSVWGKFGRDLPEWGHAQPEKCRQVLDVLMPGALVHPLRQKFEKQRHFFCGTPYGDFDFVPVESKGEFFDRYTLLLNLGWHTMIGEDYEKLRSFVRNGGTLFTGLPQFGRQEKRDFTDFRLWNNGDLSEFAGIKVFGSSGTEYSGQWNGKLKNLVPNVELSAIPSAFYGEDGACKMAVVELAGAEVEAYDAATGMPLLTSFNYGKGKVYVLTAWAYPGHEALQKFSAAWVNYLAKEHRGKWFVEDDSREIFWNVRRFEDARCGQLSMLNTDWTTLGNEKKVRVTIGEIAFEYTVSEGVPAMLTVAGDTVLETAPDNYLEFAGVKENRAEFILHGKGDLAVTFRRREGVETRSFDADPHGVKFSVAL
ncbi:MAG: hypothetical protein E7058_02835 [Lentisphaerae bacterium]|nr:hypothetical protein [Lentisphaerota bacterium]